MDLRAIEKFIDKQNVSFICSVDENGYPNVKAMLKPRKRNGLKEFYFSTNTSSMRVKQCFIKKGKQTRIIVSLSLRQEAEDIIAI